MAVKCQGMIKQKMQCDISGSSVDYVYYTRDPSRRHVARIFERGAACERSE